MPYKKNDPRINRNGRPKGSPNKTTGDLRERITILIEKNFKKIEQDFDKLDSEKRLVILERYLKFCLPTLQAMNMNAEIKSNLDSMTDDQLNDLAEKIITLNSQNHEQ